MAEGFDSWDQWSTENRQEFAEEVAVLSRTCIWIARIRLEGGEISLEQFLQWHSAKALYDWPMWGDIGFSPLAATFLRKGGGRSGILGAIDLAQSRRLEGEVLTVLPGWRRPWVPYSRRLSHDAYFLTIQVVARGSVSAADILLSLPLIEAQVLGGIGQGIHPALQPFLEARRDYTRVEQADKVIAAKFAKHAAAHDLLSGWVRGDINLVGGRKPRIGRPKGTDRTDR